VPQINSVLRQKKQRKIGVRAALSKQATTYDTCGNK